MKNCTTLYDRMDDAWRRGDWDAAAALSSQLMEELFGPDVEIDDMTTGDVWADARDVRRMAHEQLAAE